MELTQNELSQALGVNPATIYRWEGKVTKTPRHIVDWMLTAKRLVAVAKERQVKQWKERLVIGGLSGLYDYIQAQESVDVV